MAKGVVYGQSTRARAPLKKEVKFVPFMTSKIRRSNHYGTWRQVPTKETNFVGQRMVMTNLVTPESPNASICLRF